MRARFRLVIVLLALIVGAAGGVQSLAHHQPAAAVGSTNGLFTAASAPSAGVDYLTARGAVSATLPAVTARKASVIKRGHAPVHPAAPAQPVVIATPAQVVTAAPAAPPAAPAPTTSRANTGWPALDDAINHIRTYYPGIAHWHAIDKGAWGETDMNSGDIYIAPRTPLDKLLSVVEHEFMHALTGHMYGGFYPAEAAADRLFGQSGEYGLEIEADCMARVDGATWTWYTPCTNPAWRATAAILLTERKL